MQTPTINQINGRIAKNPTIQYSRQLSNQYERYNGSNYRNRYFNFKTWYKETVSLTPAGNFIFCAAEKELHRITGNYVNTTNRENGHCYFELEFSGYTLQFQIRTNISQAGVFLSCETNFKPIQDRWKDHTPYLHRHSHKIRSNEKFADLDIRKYFETVILKRYLFAPGIFRNIQIMKNCSKAEAIKFYKANISPKKDRTPADELQAHKAISRQIRRKLNIKVQDEYFTTAKLLYILKTERRRKTKAQLFKHPSIFELADQYSYQYDTDGNEETFLNEVYSDYPKNAIFI